MLWFLCVCSAQHSLKRAALICGFTLCVSSAQHKLKGAALDLPIALLCVCALHSTNWKESQCIYLLLYFVCVLCTAQTEKSHSVFTYCFTLCVCSAQHKLKRVTVYLPIALLCVCALHSTNWKESQCIYLLLYFVCVLCTAQTEKSHSVLTYCFTLCVCSAQHKLKRITVYLPIALLCVSALHSTNWKESQWTYLLLYFVFQPKESHSSINHTAWRQWLHVRRDGALRTRCAVCCEACAGVQDCCDRGRCSGSSTLHIPGKFRHIAGEPHFCIPSTPLPHSMCSYSDVGNGKMCHKWLMTVQNCIAASPAQIS